MREFRLAPDLSTPYEHCLCAALIEDGLVLDFEPLNLDVFITSFESATMTSVASTAFQALQSRTIPARHPNGQIFGGLIQGRQLLVGDSAEDISTLAAVGITAHRKRRTHREP